MSSKKFVGRRGGGGGTDSGRGGGSHGGRGGGTDGGRPGVSDSIRGTRLGSRRGSTRLGGRVDERRNQGADLRVARDKDYRSFRVISHRRNDRNLKGGGVCRGDKNVSKNVSNDRVVSKGKSHVLYDDDSEDSDYDYLNDLFDDLSGSGSEESEGESSEGVNTEGETDEGEEEGERDGIIGEGDNGEGGNGEGSNGEGGNGEDSEEEAVIAEHKKRGYSLGLFGRPPPQPDRIRMIGQVIDSPVASRTLLALMRIHWPPGCIGAKDIDRRFPKWWRRVRKMFFRYYRFDPDYGTLGDAHVAVKKHMRRNMIKILSRERKRILPLIEANGGSFIDYRPRYFTEAVWEPFCRHWESPVFHKRSKAAKEARGKQKIPHTSGATPFLRRAWDLKKETGKEPSTYDLFIRLHTRDKDNTEFTSENVRMIVSRFLDKCKEQKTDPYEASINTWVEAVGVRKNTIIGIPGASASDLIPLPPSSGKRRRRHCVDDESGASTGRSAIEHIADDFVMQAVDRTVAFARANPEQFNLAPEQINLLAQSVARGESDLPADHPLTMTTMRELVQVMVAVLGDVHAKNNGTSNSDKGKGKNVSHEEEHNSSRYDDARGSPPASPGQKRSGTLRIRG